jgi:hypothetical protein
MIRQLTVAIVATAFVASLAGPVLAQGAPSTGTTPPAAAPSTGTGGTTPKSSTMAKTKQATGAVKSAAPDNLMLVTTDKNKVEKEWTFVLDKDTKLTKGGKAIETTDIAAKDTATVAYTESDGKMVAKTVKIKAAKAAAAKPKPQP